MEDQNFSTSEFRCRVCGHDDFKFVGYQWMHIATIIRLGGTPRYVDPDQPDRAAVELYICRWCGNSVIKL